MQADEKCCASGSLSIQNVGCRLALVTTSDKSTPPPPKKALLKTLSKTVSKTKF